jgi:hypothetical protein
VAGKMQTTLFHHGGMSTRAESDGPWHLEVTGQADPVGRSGATVADQERCERALRARTLGGAIVPILSEMSAKFGIQSSGLPPRPMDPTVASARNNCALPALCYYFITARIPTSITLESPEALVPFQFRRSHRGAAWVVQVARKIRPGALHVAPRSDGMPQLSHHSTPTCLRAPPPRMQPSHVCAWIPLSLL